MYRSLSINLCSFCLQSLLLFGFTTFAICETFSRAFSNNARRCKNGRKHGGILKEKTYATRSLSRERYRNRRVKKKRARFTGLYNL